MIDSESITNLLFETLSLRMVLIIQDLEIDVLVIEKVPLYNDPKGPL